MTTRETTTAHPRAGRFRPLAVSGALHAVVLGLVAAAWTAGDPIAPAAVRLSSDTERADALGELPEPPAVDGCVVRPARTDPLGDLSGLSAFDDDAHFGPEDTPANALASDRPPFPRQERTVARAPVASVRAAPAPPEPAWSVPATAARAAPPTAPIEPATVRTRKPLPLAWNAKPRYPRRARRRGLRGVVLLEIDVRSNGTVSGVNVAASSGHAVLDDAALAAARDWRYRPATRASLTVPFTLRQPVRFDF